jgi:hypothetical protein
MGWSGILGRRGGWAAGGAAVSGALLTAAALLWPAAGPAAAGSGPGAGGTFTYDGLRYAATGLIVRPYPGPRSDSGTYWIVSYSITDTTVMPGAAPTAQVPVLFGPGGAEIAADGALGGAAPGVVNPGITWSSYEVFNVPAGASPAAYTLGFVPFQIVGGQYFAGAPLSMALPPSASATVRTPVGATYDLQNVFGSSGHPTSEQALTIGQVVETNAVAPDLTASSFDPTTSVWVVDFTLANTSSGDIGLSAGDFALDLGGEDEIAPADVPSLPGFVQPTGLQNPGGVTVPTGGTFAGSLLFEIPAGTPVGSPQLQFSANGQTRIVSLSPCAAGSCPPVLG